MLNEIYGIMIANIVMVALIRSIYLKDTKNSVEDKKVRCRDTEVILIIATIYLICSYSGIFISKLVNTSIIDKINEYTGYMLIGLIPYSILSSIAAGFRKWKIILGTCLIGVSVYAIVYLAV